MAVDIAVDPLEGTNLCATGSPDAIAVLAAAERGGLLFAPDVYMDKIVVGPTARGTVHIDAPVAENLRNIAAAFGRKVSDLTIVVLDRPRHEQLIADIREAGARIRLISRRRPFRRHLGGRARHRRARRRWASAALPKGSSPRRPCAASAARSRPVSRPSTRSRKSGSRPWGSTTCPKSTEPRTSRPATKSSSAATGVTDGELLRGVRFFGGGSRTSTLFMSLSRKIIRFIDTIHREQVTTPVRFL